MDKLGKEILDILAEDCRYSTQKIAVMLGVDEKEVAIRIKEMEKSGIIVKYMAITNHESDEDEKVEALIEVKCTPQIGQGFDGLADQIAQHSEVKAVYLMSGTYDLAVFIEGKSLRNISRFVSEKISTYNCVISTATHFILKKYKIEGTLTKKDEDTMRLSVQA